MIIPAVHIDEVLWNVDPDCLGHIDAADRRDISDGKIITDDERPAIELMVQLFEAARNPVPTVVTPVRVLIDFQRAKSFGAMMEISQRRFKNRSLEAPLRHVDLCLLLGGATKQAGCRVDFLEISVDRHGFTNTSPIVELQNGNRGIRIFGQKIGLAVIAGGNVDVFERNILNTLFSEENAHAAGIGKAFVVVNFYCSIL